MASGDRAPPRIGQVYVPTKPTKNATARTIIAPVIVGLNPDAVWFTTNGTDASVCTPGYWSGWVKRNAAVCQEPRE